jgi:signal transduction histidine kinase
LIAAWSVASMLCIVAGVVLLASAPRAGTDGSILPSIEVEIVFALAGAASAGAAALAIMEPSRGRRRAEDSEGSRPGEEQAVAEMPSGSELVGELEALLGEIMAAQEAQSRLMRDIGHDLRSPLASIVAMAECLRQGDFGPVTQEQARAFELLETTARRLTSQTEALYALHDARDRGGTGRPTDFDAAATTLAICEGLRSWAEGRGLDFEVRVPDGPLRVRADKPAVERILAHVLDDAIKATESGGITVELSGDAHHLELLVSDTRGQGHAGAPGHSTKDRASASGTSMVGLAAAAELAASLGGSLTRADGETGGCTFLISLPSNAPDDTETDSAHQPTTQPGGDEASPGGLGI